MKNKISTTLIVLLFTNIFFSNNIFADMVNKSIIEKVAVNFFIQTQDYSINKDIDKSKIKIDEIIEKENLFYVKFYPKGWVIVSKSDKVKPVLAYSFENNFTTEDNILPFELWIKNINTQIKKIEYFGIKAADEVSAEWNNLINNTYKSTSSDFVEPLLITKWNQGFPYNELCPFDVDANARCVTGCVATAMAQLLYYYRFPDYGTGQYSYNHPKYGEISANFGETKYLWNEIPSAVNKKNNALAVLNYHQGVTVDMDYGPQASGMWNHSAANSLKNYFNGGPETRYYFRDSNEVDWDSLIIANLNNRKPLYYAGWESAQMGHAFICDGYQPGNYYHFNWGWGGSLDGYFYTDNLTPGGNFFNNSQEIITYFPDTLNFAYPFDNELNNVITNLTGSIDDGSVWYKYKNNLNKTWILKPTSNELDSIAGVSIIFTFFDLAEGDFVKIYDNKTNELIHNFDKNNNPGTTKYSLNSNEIKIEFITDQNNNSFGWLLNFETILPVYCNTNTSINSPQGYLSDGSEEKNYMNNSNCIWTIKNNENSPLHIGFTKFNLADTNDFVRIIDMSTQNTIGTFTGTEIPEVITIEGGKVFLIFRTNDTIVSDGWEAYFYTSDFSVENENIQKSKIFPNPVKDFLNIEINSNIKDRISISIVDELGRIYLSELMNIDAGTNRAQLNVSNLDKMAYYLMIQYSSGKKEFFPVIILN